jgi:ligand-binding sensor domain-containing protein
LALRGCFILGTLEPITIRGYLFALTKNRLVRQPLTLTSVLAALLAVFPAWGLDPRKALTQYTLDRWDSSDGLIEESLNAITQSPDGYLWLASADGLVRFDGIRFTTYRMEGKVPRNNSVRAIAWAADGSMRVAARDGRIFEVLRNRLGTYANPVFQPVFASPGQSLVQSQGMVKGPGGLYLTMPTGAYRVLEGKPGQLEEVQLDGIPAARVFASNLQELWIADRTGRIFLRDGSGTRETASSPDIAGERPTALLVDRSRRIWVGSHDGISLFAAGKWTRLRAPGVGGERK